MVQILVDEHLNNEKKSRSPYHVMLYPLNGSPRKLTLERSLQYHPEYNIISTMFGP